MSGPDITPPAAELRSAPAGGLRRVLRTLLIVGVLGQLVFLMICAFVELIFSVFNLNDSWNFFLYPLAPGFYIATLFMGRPGMDDPTILLPMFALNALLYTAIWIAGSAAWQRWRRVAHP